MLLTFVAASAAKIDNPGAWMTEPGVSPPGYAITTPLATDLNVDVVVLMCVDAPRGRSLELDLYLSDTGPLIPGGADAQLLKDIASVEIEVDGKLFAAELLFTDGYVVVADALDGDQPLLSPRLLKAMQSGQTMLMRFDLMRDGDAGGSRFDGRLVIDLEAGREAIASVRRCVAEHSYEAAH